MPYIIFFIRVYLAVALLGVLGLMLIWKGITGDITKAPLGDNLVPRWTYILGGCILLLFPVMLVLVRTDAGRSWLGLS